MRPAGGFGEAAGFVEPIEAGIAVGLQHTGEGPQVLTWMLALAIRRIAIEHGGRRLPAQGRSSRT